MSGFWAQFCHTLTAEAEASPSTAPPSPICRDHCPPGILRETGVTSQPTHLECPRTFHTGFIRGDGGTLDSYTVLLGGQCGVDSDLVISLVTVWEPQVEILELDIHVGQDELETDGQGKASAQMTWASAGTGRGHSVRARGRDEEGQQREEQHSRGLESAIDPWGPAKAGWRPGL